MALELVHMLCRLGLAIAKSEKGIQSIRGSGLKGGHFLSKERFPERRSIVEKGNDRERNSADERPTRNLVFGLLFGKQGNAI